MSTQSPTDNLPAPRGRIPSLDGWRGIAIALVLIDHIQVAFTHRLDYKWGWTQTGQHGVTIFFVLSGFLITSKLLEKQIDLKDFYVRRFFRLMPVAWAYLAVLVFLSIITRVQFTTPAEIWSSLFFYRNFAIVGGYGMAGHFWSLSMEEQFYLVWPCILLLAGVRRCRWIAAGGAVACAVYRWYFWPRYDRFLMNEQTQVRADALLVGCLLALLLTDQRFCAVARSYTRALAIPALAVLLYCVARFHQLPPLIENLSIATLIAASVLHPQSFPVRAISVRPLTWLGVISYSVYVWQELFVHLGTGDTRLISLFVALPAFSLASYYGIERHSIRLGRRLSQKWRITDKSEKLSAATAD